MIRLLIEIQNERKKNIRKTFNPIVGIFLFVIQIPFIYKKKLKMVVLDASALGGALLGGPYAQGAPQLKLVQKRYLGIHHWLSPVATKDLKEQIVSRD